MATLIEGPVRTFTAGGALAQYRRVVLVAGVLALAGVTDYDIGTVTRPTFNTGDPVAVWLRSAQGTTKMTANGAITANATVYAAADGKIAGTGTVVLGTALQAAAADGDVIEVLRLAPSAAWSPNAIKTANYAVTAADSGTTFTTAGAAGAVTFALPAATVGLKYRFHVGAAQALDIDPNGTETIALPSTGVQGAAGKYLGCATAGATVSIECCVAGTWSVFGSTGTWAAEA